MIGLLFIGCRNLQDWMALPVSKGLAEKHTNFLSEYCESQCINVKIGELSWCPGQQQLMETY